MLEAKKALLLLLVWAVPTTAGAQLLPSFDSYAEAIVSGMGRRWDGPRVPWPTEGERPVAAASTADDRSPVHVHVARFDDQPALEPALRGVLAMRGMLRRLGWDPLPRDTLGPDGGFDLYVIEGPETWDALSDGPYVPSALDTATAHAVLSRRLSPARLEACAAEAYAGALLLALDPAEAPSWRRATAGYLGYVLTGRFDACADDVDLAQRDPTRTWIGEDGLHTGGALLLAMLADRHDGGGGTFVRELWNMARQHTWDGEGLRASPDMWEALERAIVLSGLTFHDTLIDAAIARALPSLVRTPSSIELPTIRALPHDLGARIDHARGLATLPAYLPVSAPIAMLGSTYAHVDARGAAPGARVRVWLRGEVSTRWSLAVVGFDASGREVSRVRAPVSERDRSAYVPYELEPRVTDLLVTVTNIGEARPDADLSDAPPHACRLIIALAAPGDVSGAP